MALRRRVSERAARAGFTIPVWHGTRSETAISRFNTDMGGGKDFGVHVGGSPFQANNRFWGTASTRRYWSREHRRTASGKDPQRHAEVQRERAFNYRNASIMPLVMRARKIVDVPDLGRWDDPKRWLDKMTSPVRREIVERDRAMRYGAKMKSPGKIHSWGYIVPAPNALAQSMDQRVWKDLTRVAVKAYVADDYEEGRTLWKEGLKAVATKHGIDAFRYANETEGHGDPSYLVVDPDRNLRSTSARFENTEAGDLLALTRDRMPKGGLAAANRRLLSAIAKRVRALGSTRPSPISSARVARGLR